MKKTIIQQQNDWNEGYWIDTDYVSLQQARTAPADKPAVAYRKIEVEVPCEPVPPGTAHGCIGNAFITQTAQQEHISSADISAKNIHGMRSDLAAARQRIAELEKKIVETASECWGLRQNYRKAEKRIIQLQQELAEAIEAIDAAKDALDKYHGSPSPILTGN